MSLAPDAENRRLRAGLREREWHPVWVYENVPRDRKNYELEGKFPSWFIGRFWSEGSFGLGHFSVDDGPNRPLVFPSHSPRAQPVLGELYYVCFDTRLVMDLTVICAEIGELAAVRLLGWGSPVWALIGNPQAHDERYWLPLEREHRCGMIFGGLPKEGQ
jgi:hypothetical protein